LSIDKTGAAKHHHRVLDAGLGLGQIRLEHFQLEPDATGFPAQQKFRIGKRQAVSLWLHPIAGG